MEKKKLDLDGAQLVSLACALAISFSEVYGSEDLRRLRLFFQSIASNITIIELEGLNKNKEKIINKNTNK